MPPEFHFDSDCFGSDTGDKRREDRFKYAALVIDLENAGFIVHLMCFEISVRGQVTKAYKMRLKSLIHKYTDAGSQGFKK